MLQYQDSVLYFEFSPRLSSDGSLSSAYVLCIPFKWEDNRLYQKKLSKAFNMNFKNSLVEKSPKPILEILKIKCSVFYHGKSALEMDSNVDWIHNDFSGT